MFDTFYVSVTCLGKMNVIPELIREINQWNFVTKSGKIWSQKKCWITELEYCICTCHPPEYKNLEMSRNLCIVRMSLRYFERPGDLMKKLGDSRENRESWQVWYCVNYHSYNKEQATAEYPATSKVLPWRVWIRGYKVAKTTLSLEII